MKMWFTLLRRPVALRFAVAMLAALLCGRVAAQTTTGSVYGTVADPTGAVIPDAAITITNDQAGIAHTVKSDASGNYLFPALPPGPYTASGGARGFSTEVEKGIHLDVAQSVNVSFVLKPGASGQTITVTAATTLVDTRESQLGETVDRQRIQDLPLDGRDVYDLVQLVPGVTNYAAGPEIGDNTGTNFVTNGIRPNFNSVYLDGGYDDSEFRNQGNLLPNPDAIDQFRLLTSNFDAEFGRSPGGVVNVITRSGTNSFHGVIYEYLRNNVLNAKSYFNNEVTPLKRNQFGATFGGPVKRDRLFFFISYQGLRIATPAVVSSSLTTLTPLEASGDFSASAIKPKLPAGTNCGTTAAPVICPTAFDPVAKKLLTYVPLENPATLQPPEQSASANTTADQGLVRVDYQLSDKHELSAMFFTSRGTSLNPTGVNQILDFSGKSSYANQSNVVVSDRWIISATKLNSLHLFYTLNHYVTNPSFPYTWSSLGSQVKEGAPITDQAEFILTGYWTMGIGGNDGAGNIAQEPIGAIDTFNWTRGSHTIKFGGSFTWNHFASTGVGLGSGKAKFSGGVTKNALADFELGRSNSFQQDSGTFFRQHESDPALFLQDDWRMTNRLTLDLGIRWEAYPPFSGQNNLGTFAPNVESTRFPTAPLGLLTTGDPGVPDGVLITSWKRFAPRLGFAYDVFGNGQTSLRGAYGIFYSVNQEDFTENLEQMPFTLAETLSSTPNLVCPYGGNALTCPTGTPAGTDPYPYVVSVKSPVFPAGATISAMAPHESATPYVEEYNLTLQQQFGADWGVQFGYVGNVMRKGYISRDENSPIYVPGASTTTAGLNARRPYEPTPSSYVFGQIGDYDAVENSSYNSLQAKLTKRFSHGFSLSASYVWSKLMDFDSQDPSGANGSTLVDQNDIGMDYGLSDYDVPQDFVASYLWAAPAMKHWGWLGRQVLSGWQLNGITTLTSGSPFTVTSNVDSNLDGNVNDRPNQAGNPVLAASRSRSAKIVEFFNTAAFVNVPAGAPYGNVHRNSLIGPGYINTDFSGFKTFPIWKESTLQFRGEIFNLFNNVNFANPNAVMSAASYGRITGTTGNPRIVQFALRLSF
jgi:hypothetical protein